MYCLKHPKEKMTLLLDRYVCDICDPPGGVAHTLPTVQQGGWWTLLGFENKPKISNGYVIGAVHALHAAHLVLEIPAVYQAVDGEVEVFVFKNRRGISNASIKIPSDVWESEMRPNVFEYRSKPKTPASYLVAFEEVMHP